MKKLFLLAFLVSFLPFPVFADCVDDEQFCFGKQTRHKISEIDDAYLASEDGQRYLRKKTDGKEIDFLKKNKHPKIADIRAACTNGELEGKLCEVK